MALININLLPKDLRRSTGPNYWTIASVAVAGVSLLTMLGFQLAVEGTLRNINNQIAEAQSEIAVRAPDVAERDRLLAEQNQLQAITNVATTLRAGQTSWSDDLARFVRQLPSGNTPAIALNNLTMRTVASADPSQAAGVYDGKAVTREVVVNGRARSSAALVRFVDAFEQAQDFGIQFPTVSREDTTGDYTFSTTIGMIGSQPPADPNAAPGQTPPDGTTPPADPANAPGSSGQTPSAPASANATPGGTR